MAKKKIKRDCIVFTGQSAHDVTGSQYLIQFNGMRILLECGLHQSSSNSYLDSYRINSARFQFKPSDIDYVFINHAHIDHCGLLPRLVKEGFTGKIITTGKSAAIMKPLLLNACYIIHEEARILSKKYKRAYMPIYDQEDVYHTLAMIQTYDEYGEVYSLSDQLQFQWIDNSHCVGAAQLYLLLGSGNKTKRILYSSDIGALKTKNHYVVDTAIPDMRVDVAIMESTYGANSKNKRSRREQDLKLLRSAVDTVTGRGGTIIMPCFSFSRTQEMLTALYLIYGNMESFKIPVIVDSELSCDICNIYDALLAGMDYELWMNVRRWKNVQMITDRNESRACIANQMSKVVIAPSGFCTNGRVVNYLKKYLCDSKSMIVFSGYTGDNQSYLSYRIKNHREQKNISINKEKIRNEADCITLSSFSSHANQADLIHYGSALKTNKLILVHGSEESKKCLASKLKDAISKNDKSFKVICSTKDMVVYL